MAQALLVTVATDGRTVRLWSLQPAHCVHTVSIGGGPARFLPLLDRAVPCIVLASTGPDAELVVLHVSPDPAVRSSPPPKPLRVPSFGLRSLTPRATPGSCRPPRSTWRSCSMWTVGPLCRQRWRLRTTPPACPTSTACRPRRSSPTRCPASCCAAWRRRSWPRARAPRCRPGHGPRPSSSRRPRPP